MHSHWKWVWAKNENTVNLKSASFVVIMLLHEGLTHLRSQKKPWLHFGKSFTLGHKSNNDNFEQHDLLWKWQHITCSIFPVSKSLFWGPNVRIITCRLTRTDLYPCLSQRTFPSSVYSNETFSQAKKAIFAEFMREIFKPQSVLLRQERSLTSEVRPKRAITGLLMLLRPLVPLGPLLPSLPHFYSSIHLS